MVRVEAVEVKVGGGGEGREAKRIEPAARESRSCACEVACVQRLILRMDAACRELNLIWKGNRDSHLSPLLRWHQISRTRIHDLQFPVKCYKYSPR